MGLEANSTVTVGDETFAVKALLESRELILRGDFRKIFAIAEITAAFIEGDMLVFRHADQSYVLPLPAGQADRWLKKLTTPPPSLAAKLGIDAGHPAFVTGVVNDPALMDALAGATTESPCSAAFGVIVAETPAALAEALKAAQPDRPLWIIYPKGAKSPLPEATVRTHMHGAGYVDTKTSAVSERLTALRFHRKSAV